MNIAFDGIGEQVASFIASGTIAAGQPVKLSANGTVTACGVGDKFFGIALNTRNGICAVQFAGFCKVKASTTLSVGINGVLVDNAQGIKAVETGGQDCTVVEYNSTSGTAVILL